MGLDLPVLPHHPHDRSKPSPGLAKRFIAAACAVILLVAQMYGHAPATGPLSVTTEIAQGVQDIDAAPTAQPLILASLVAPASGSASPEGEEDARAVPLHARESAPVDAGTVSRHGAPAHDIRANAFRARAPPLPV